MLAINCGPSPWGPESLAFPFLPALTRRSPSSSGPPLRSRFPSGLVCRYPDGGGGRGSGVNASPGLESDPRALMGLANKNDRHATHLSPRELLFNGLHPALALRRLVEPVW